MFTDSSSSDNTDMEEAVSNKDNELSKSIKSKSNANKKNATESNGPVQDARRYTASSPPTLKRNDSDLNTIMEPTAKLSEMDVTFTIDGMESPLNWMEIYLAWNLQRICQWSLL